MGALTEAMDKFCSREGYYTARREYNALREQYDLDSMDEDDLMSLHDKVVQKYEEGDRAARSIAFDVSYNLLRFLGIESHKFFVFYDWTFGEELADSVAAIKRICAATPGLSCSERMSTDDDFFLFHPIEHGPGLEIVDDLNRPPHELTELFQEVVCSKREYPHQLVFTF